MFCSYAPDGKEHFDSYQVHKLHSKLQNFYGDEIIVYTQRGQGQSNIIISSHVSLADAVKECAILKESFHAEQLEFWTPEPKAAWAKESNVLHAAVGVLRYEITKIPISTEYYSAADLDIGTTVPEKLKQFMIWLISHDAFENADSNFIASDKINRKALDLAQCLIYACKRSVVPPLQHGLAAHLYHTYGKRELIDTLHSHGFTISYQDLRTFITSVAETEISHMKENVYVPYGLVHRQNGGKLNREGDDNRGINCKRLCIQPC